MVKRICYIISVIFGIIWAAAQISPDQAGSNLLKWIKIIGTLHIPVLHINPSLLISLIAPIIGSLVPYYMERKLNSVKKKLEPLNIRRGLHTEQKTLTLALDSDYNAIWHMGQKNGKPIMTFSAELYVTNRAQVPIIVTGMTTTADKKLIVQTHVSVMNAANVYDKNVAIPPGHTTKLHITMAIWPFGEVRQDSLEMEISIIDQFNNNHWIKLSFASTQSLVA